MIASFPILAFSDWLMLLLPGQRDFFFVCKIWDQIDE
jgi:hypothetical protein